MKMKRSCRVATIAAAATLSVVRPAPSVAQESAALSKQREAQAVLDRAVGALGGAEAIGRLETARVELASQLANVGQGATPSAPPAEQPPGSVIIHSDGGRAVYQNFQGDNLTFRFVRDPAGSWAHIAGPNTINEVDLAAAVPFLSRVTLSPMIVREATARPEALRSLGSASSGGSTFDVVTYADPVGRQVTLYFDASSGLLSRTETVADHAQFGDQVTAVDFSDYRDLDGLQVPHKLVRRQGDLVAAQTTLTSLEFGVAADPTLFERPEDATEGQRIALPPGAPGQLEVEELADGVFLVPNAAPNYNAMFVVYDEGILVLETPQTPAVSQAVIATIRNQFPDIPIRWAVPTHYHFDHSGGLYGYVREGIAIVTTSGNEEFVREVAAAPRTLSGGSGGTDRVIVETFVGRRSFGEGSRRVELYDVGPNPHVDEIIVAYLPELNLLFVADLFSFQGDVNPANQNALAFAERLEELDLELTTVLPVHGEAATADQFWESIRHGRQQAEEN
jgi:glyoxylase-like metal-dependent hydrolase (beta-lactamase superfamily II)